MRACEFLATVLVLLGALAALASGDGGVYECEVMRGIVYEDGEALSPVNATVRGSPLPESSTGVILSVRTTAYARKLGLHVDAPGVGSVDALHTSLSVYKDPTCDASSRVATNKTEGAPLLVRVPLLLSARSRLSGACKQLYVRAALDYSYGGSSGEVSLVATSSESDATPCVPISVCSCVPPQPEEDKDASTRHSKDTVKEEPQQRRPGRQDMPVSGGQVDEREDDTSVVAQSIDDSFYIRMATYNLEDYARISANVAPLPNCTIPDGVGVFHVKRVSIWVMIAVAIAVAAVIMVAFMIANGISRSRHKPVELY